MAAPERRAVEVAVGVLVRPDGTVLAGSRPEGKPYAGYWEFPGGKLEQDETPEMALAREMREELDLEVRSASPWFVRVLDYPHARVRLHFLKSDDWSGEPRAMEGQSFGFFPWNGLPEGKILPLVEQVFGWTRLPAVAARVSADFADQRLMAAYQAGARLFFFEEPFEGALPEDAWAGSDGFFIRAGEPRFRGGAAAAPETLKAMAEAGADFALVPNSVQLLYENPLPLYREAESAAEAAAARRQGWQGVWLRF